MLKKSTSYERRGLDKVGAYQLTTNWNTANAGTAKWAFAKQNDSGEEVFIKEFIDPVYPMDRSKISPEQCARKVKICEDFEQRKRRFYNTLNKCSNGNLVVIKDFFRHRSRFYIVTEKVDVASISIKEISKLDDDVKILIAKVLTHNVKRLHDENIVHSDLKPENILIKRTEKGYYTAKLIDFDGSFFESDAPQNGDDLPGDMVYYAPESLRYTAVDERIRVTTKIDVFALGILFHQYFTGALPKFDTEQYDYICEASLSGGKVMVSTNPPMHIVELIRWMLRENPHERPNLDQVFKVLSGNMAVTPPYPSPIPSEPPPTPLKSDLKKGETMEKWFSAPDDL